MLSPSTNDYGTNNHGFNDWIGELLLNNRIIQTEATEEQN